MQHVPAALLRTDIDNLRSIGLEFAQPWQVIDHFEQTIAEFFGAPLAVATDSCTHGLELVLRHDRPTASIQLPRHTYMSVPMMLDKLQIPYDLAQIEWQDRYAVTPTVIDAATSWRARSYRPGTCMVISFQYKKHIPIGRGGMILLDDPVKYQNLQRMVRDGRDPRVTQWDDTVQTLGYHYHMLPEDAARGIMLFENLKSVPAKQWCWRDYRDLMEFPYFQKAV